MLIKEVHNLLWYYSIVLLCLFAIVSSDSLSAQTVYTDQDILQSAVRKHEAKLKNLNTQQKLSLPKKQLIDQMEFRTEFNELDFDQQEYLFRMRFRKDKVRKLQNELLELQRDLIVNKSKSEIDDGSERIFKSIIALYFNQELDSLMTYKLKLLEDKNSIATTLLLTDDNVDFNDALKIKERQSEISKELYDLKWQKENVLNILGISDETFRLDIRRLIAVEALSKVTENALSLEELHPDLSTFEARMDITAKERQLEEVDTETLLRFAQIKYEADDKQSLERELSFGLGFTLPFKKVNENELAKLELDQIELRLEKQETLLDIAAETEEENIELINRISKYQYLVQLFGEENLAQLKTEYLRSERVEAMPLINLELMLIDRQIELLESRQEIYMQYITTLERTGALQFSKNTNWLNQGLSPIE